MRNKKIVRIARELRPCLNWEDSIKVSKAIEKDTMDEDDIIEFLENKGYNIKRKVEGYCPDDDFPEGFYIITNSKGIQTKNLKFSCTGLYIDYKPNQHRFISLSTKEIFVAGQEIKHDVYFYKGNLCIEIKGKLHMLRKGEFKQVGKRSDLD